MHTPLLHNQTIDENLEDYLTQVGTIFRAFLDHDSHCVAYGVQTDAGRWFVKHSAHPQGVASLKRALHLNTLVQHPALPRLHHHFTTPENSLALVYDWVPGTLIREFTRGAEAVNPHNRLRALPLASVVGILNTVYDVHIVLADHDFVAKDFYDGCIIYDFEQAQTYICDLDEYHIGPFTNTVGRMMGSSRFMAPEEFQRGARIDQATNVFTLGRTAFILLGDGSGKIESWRGTDAMRRVISRATQPDRTKRYPTVRDFVQEWQIAIQSL